MYKVTSPLRVFARHTWSNKDNDYNEYNKTKTSGD